MVDYIRIWSSGFSQNKLLKYQISVECHIRDYIQSCPMQNVSHARQDTSDSTRQMCTWSYICIPASASITHLHIHNRHVQVTDKESHTHTFTITVTRITHSLGRWGTCDFLAVRIFTLNLNLSKRSHNYISTRLFFQSYYTVSHDERFIADCFEEFRSSFLLNIRRSCSSCTLGIRLIYMRPYTNKEVYSRCDNYMSDDDFERCAHATKRIFFLVLRRLLRCCSPSSVLSSSAALLLNQCLLSIWFCRAALMRASIIYISLFDSAVKVCKV